MKLERINQRETSRRAAILETPITDREKSAGAKAIVALFRKWNLTDAEACNLLGGMSLATYSRWKRGEFGRVGVDLATRLSILLGIHKALRIIFTEQTRIHEWIKRPNLAFGGRSALETMLEGQITDLMRVRHYLDAARG